MKRPASDDVPPSLPSSHVPSCVILRAAGRENALSAALPTGTAIGGSKSGAESKSGPSGTVATEAQAVAEAGELRRAAPDHLAREVQRRAVALLLFARADDTHEQLVLDEREITDRLEVQPVVIADGRLTWPVLSPCGFFESKRIAPPMLFLPNSVPCGPRSTSTRSKSTRSMSEPVIVL